MAELQSLYTSRMAALNFTAAHQAQVSSRLHFANESVLSNTNSFMQGVLAQWVSPSNVITAASADGSLNGQSGGGDA
jgi:hypothetical protein